MRSFSSLLFSLVFTLAFTRLQAQSNVKGQLSDVDESPLEFATVVLHSSADSSIVKAGYSDTEGKFIVGPVNAGNYFLRITYIGYPATSTAAFDLAENESKELPAIKIAPTGTELKEVTITTEKPLVTVKPDMMVFNVEGTVNAVGEDAFNLLRKAPGVMVDNNDNIMVLGKSGVRVLIDGKPSPLSAADLANLLKSMPSTQIESFEIITNPSSKYDAEGNAGIINIKMKRDKNMGANATVSLDYSAWIYHRFNGSASANYRSKNFNAFGSYTNGIGKQRNFMHFLREIGGQSFEINTIMVRDYQNHNFRGGLDYFIGANHTIGFLASGVISDGTHDSNSQNLIRNVANDSLTSVLESLQNSTFNRQNYNGNLNYRYDNKLGRTLNVDLDYGTFRNKATAFMPNIYYNPITNVETQNNTFSNNSPTDIDIMTAKADYEQNLWKGKLGLGVKGALVTTKNTFDFFNQVGGTMQLDSNRSNTFDYSENVNAAYMNYQRQLKKWNVQLGLRAEQTNSLGILTAFQETDNDTVDRHYISLFPSAGLTYNLNQTNTFRASYSRRIDRPRYEDLNPFVNQLDELSFRVGNPFLQPQFTHNMELGYTYKYTFNATASYAITNGFFTNLVDTIDFTKTIMTQRNLSTRKVATLSVSYPWSPVKWWNTFTNASVFNATNAANFGVGKDIKLSVTSFTFFHQSTFNLPKDFGIQLSGFYSSPGIWGANFHTIHMKGVDAGVTKKLFKQHGLLKVGMSDIFFTMQWGGEQQFGALNIAGGGGWESRQIKASYTHTFGNANVKGRRRSTGLEDEQKRAGGGGDAPGGR